jgi:hypothetical protein
MRTVGSAEVARRTTDRRTGDIMSERPKPGYECRHQLAEWVRLHCPCATERGGLLRGLLAIVERELEAAEQRSRPQGGPTPPANPDGGPA